MLVRFGREKVSLCEVKSAFAEPVWPSEDTQAHALLPALNHVSSHGGPVLLSWPWGVVGCQGP